ncbi:hypothetical protein BV22DRAFT_1200324 [Leucogyrophana mollusca]|uniref:Uncharacterized protein n=1 Tax=Leucogyrophana mollusca TaxID=85980 RepID=A0ACB8AWC7_9AGAM|nr:hypothetical protein BV22DRAFT_1200324 [Leucogyrophana mollusca]
MPMDIWSELGIEPDTIPNNVGGIQFDLSMFDGTYEDFVARTGINTRAIEEVNQALFVPSQTHQATAPQPPTAPDSLRTTATTENSLCNSSTDPNSPHTVVPGTLSHCSTRQSQQVTTDDDNFFSKLAATEKRPRVSSVDSLDKPLVAKRPKKENILPPAAKDVKPKVEEADAGSTWSVEDTTILINALFSVENESMYTCYRNNAKVAFKKLAERQPFSTHRSVKSIETKFQRLRQDYLSIVQFEGWTGNGGGDPDIDNKTLDANIKAAGKAGRQVGALSAAKYRLWMDEKRGNWFKTLDYRFSEHPGLHRAIEHRSGSISDIDDESDHDSDIEFVSQPPPKTLTPPVGKTQRSSSSSSSARQGGVPIPLHKGRARTGLGSEVTEFFSSSAEYLKGQLQGEKARMQLLEQKAAQEREEGKVAHAQEVLRNPGATEKVRAAAEKFLENYFNSEF